MKFNSNLLDNNRSRLWPYTFWRTKISNHLDLVLIIAVYISTITISFYSALKRYNNFEFGKFDLGNMSQIVWNTLNGRFFTLTDQFGTDMSRLGMSHFDPILLIFTPLYALIPNPMILVFAQHLIFVSAIIPIYFLTKKYLRSRIISFVVVITYIIYPPVGYTLVWTEFHGITFVAPIFLWMVYFLETKNYLVNASKKSQLIYWVLIILQLSGKEEIGAILAIYAIFLFFRNKKIAIYTFILSTIWFLISFFILIPSANQIRDQSVNNFIEFVGENSQNANEDVQGKNFFYKRYSYLGDSYTQMIVGLITNPSTIIQNTPVQTNLNTTVYLFGPFLFIPLLSGLWLIGLPDFAITILSDEEIFKISNHRISFIIVAIFLSYILGLKFLKQKIQIKHINKILLLISIIVFVVNCWFSVYLANPLTYNILNRLGIYKFVTPVVANQIQGDANQNTSDKKLYSTAKAQLPANNVICLTKARDYVLDKNPQIYSGPDYLGAHLANRSTNALFPARIDETQIFIADLIEDKIYEPLESADSWTLNKRVLRTIFAAQNYRHVFSCGRISVFEKSEISDVGQSVVITNEQKQRLDLKPINAKRFGIDFAIIKSPTKQDTVVEYAISRQKSTDLTDKLLFWKFKSKSGRSIDMIDYGPFTLDQNNLNEIPSESGLVIKKDFGFVAKEFGDEPFTVRYGITNQLDGQEMYLGEWQF